jgi:hypothetical protein
MKGIREFFIFYFFFFYAYFYFSVDEEFMVFIVIFIWLLFFITFYLKILQNFFKDNIFLLIDEYFFFHNKRNLFLSIIRDQFYDVILLNNFISFFFLNLIVKINKKINIKLIDFYEKANIFIKERLNFYKSKLKVLYIYSYLTTFIFFYKVLIFLLLNQSNCFDFFFVRIFSMKKEFDLRNSVSGQITSNIYFKSYKKALCSLIYRLLFVKEFVSYKLKNLTDKKKKILKVYKILRLVLLLGKNMIVKKIKINPTRWFYLKKLPIK